MPRHVMIMWLLAGGGTLVGATLTYLATRSGMLPATAQVRSGWNRARAAFPAIFSRQRSASTGRFTKRTALAPTGSSAFDEYRSMQLANLEHEAGEFRRFLQRLRDARDREEFDAFMKEAKSPERAKSPVTIENE